MNGSGLGVLAVGLVLCLAGTFSVHLAVAASGFALGWLLTEPFEASFRTALFVGLAAALAAWVLAKLVFRAAMFFVGALAGGVSAAKLFGLLEQGDGNVAVGVLFTAAVAVLAGVATERYRRTALVAVCALGGAGLTLSGVARAFPDPLDFLRFPQEPWEAVVATAGWLLLAALGWASQQRIARARGDGRASRDGPPPPRDHRDAP